MKRLKKILVLALLICALRPSALLAGNSAKTGYNVYILQSPGLAQAQAACQTYGMTMLSTVHAPDTYLVEASASVPPEILKQWVAHDTNVKHLELDPQVQPTQTSMITPYIPSLPLTAYVTDGNLVKLYGSFAWLGYVQQPAAFSTNAADSVNHHITGSGIVAVIDTGVDPDNPILAPVLVPGYDFTRNVSGYASDDGDLDQSSAHILHLYQSSAHILHYSGVTLNGHTVGILDDATAAALQTSALPSEFGHGTMVAGLIHLVAPTAQIMSLKAFNADGTADAANIIQAIYYAADNGARVINMSFGLPQISDALMQAINYAAQKGVVCIASAGNDGQDELIYPAAFGNVIGVGSVDQQNQPSTFSNFGSDIVKIAAPGEALITTYPGNHYAAVWGTSFSSAIVSGAAIDMLSNIDPHISPLMGYADVLRAMSKAVPCGTAGSLGAGCLDFDQAVNFLHGTNFPH